MYIREGITCKLALRQVKQWCHYVWCWRHNMRRIISDKYPSLKTFRKMSQSQNCQESLVLLQWKYKRSVTSEMIWYFFTVEKYQFYSHLICIELAACDKTSSHKRFWWPLLSLDFPRANSEFEMSVTFSWWKRPNTNWGIHFLILS